MSPRCGAPRGGLRHALSQPPKMADCPLSFSSHWIHCNRRPCASLSVTIKQEHEAGPTAELTLSERHYVIKGDLASLPALGPAEEAQVLIFASPAHFDSATWRKSKHSVSVMSERTQTRHRLAKLSTFKGEIFIFYILNSPRGKRNMFFISLVFKNLSYLKSKGGCRKLWIQRTVIVLSCRSK